jgi:ATP-binding cassette subfamily F protein 3
MSVPDFNNDAKRVEKTTAELKTKQGELAEIMEKWEEATMALEG